MIFVGISSSSFFFFFLKIKVHVFPLLACDPSLFFTEATEKIKIQMQMRIQNPAKHLRLKTSLTDNIAIKMKSYVLQRVHRRFLLNIDVPQV